jgi:capsular polysaccharide export protein
MSAPAAMIGQDDGDIKVACGMAWWKRKRIAQFLAAEKRAPLLFIDDARQAVAAAGDGAIAVWPSRMPDGLEKLAGDRLVRVEDGFIRSIGLGADLHPPLSIVVDRSGIYYDPSRPSDLETILENAAFPPALLARAEALIDTIVMRGISKYASEPPASVPMARTRRTILVPGQVEDDLSVRRGGADVAGNLDLLRRARAAEPDAHILFKPHPDVDAGHRLGHVADAELRRYADEIVRGESMPALLARVDGVHVLTSLTGFEALLRGLDVTVHGLPFFAGWGLTHDLAPPVARRTRILSLAELVAGTLILYPRYLDPLTERPCPPETLLQRFADGWRPKLTWLIRLRRLQGRIARLFGTVSR